MLDHDFRTEEDFKLVNKLLSQGPYKIAEHIRSRVISNAATILEDPNVDQKIRLAAMRTLLLADKINLDLIKISMPKKVEKLDVKQLSDQDLLEAIEITQKLLPKQLLLK